MNKKIEELEKRIAIREKQLKQEQYDKSVMAQLLRTTKADYDLVMGTGKADELAEKVKREEQKNKSDDQPLVDLDSPITYH